MTTPTAVPHLTRSAERAGQIAAPHPGGVVRRRALLATGVTRRTIASNVSAGRWRQVGQAVVLHAGPVSVEQRRDIAMANVGSRALLTSLTALEDYGLSGWRREAVHVAVPTGARLTKVPGIRVVTHQLADWTTVRCDPAGRRHGLPEAAVLAADSFPGGRAACAVFAAIVQQRIMGPDALRGAVAASPRMRHRSAVLAALDDIAMGAGALSEIDFVRLCRRLGLPDPVMQAVRVEPDGRRRYLDAEWVRPDGTRVAVEVDGALHLIVRRWWDDQMRQNEVVLDGTVMLRFPSVLVRAEEPAMIDQLIRAVLGPGSRDIDRGFGRLSARPTVR